MSENNQDDLNLDLNTEDEETPPAPTAGKGTGSGDEDDRKSQEEIEWAQLKGSTQDRVRQLIHERDEARQLANTKKQDTEVPPAPPAPPSGSRLSAEQRDAIDNLRAAGVITRDDLEQVVGKMLEQNQLREDRRTLNDAYEKLESQFDGSDFPVKFDRTEVEDFMRKNAIYDPLVAFKNMYEDEWIDWKVSQNGGTKSRTSIRSERPTNSSNTKGEPISAEAISERLKRPDGKQWWEKNRMAILPKLGDIASS